MTYSWITMPVSYAKSFSKIFLKVMVAEPEAWGIETINKK